MEFNSIFIPFSETFCHSSLAEVRGPGLREVAVPQPVLAGSEEANVVLLCRHEDVEFVPYDAEHL